MKEATFPLRRRRGIYYTPDAMSKLLSAWAIRTPSDRVLEPAFGGCGFIASIEQRLSELSSAYPWRQIFGCDIDPQAFKKHLQNILPDHASRNHFLKEDFLKLYPEDFKIDGFDVILGNPPYVSYHNMFKAQRMAAIRVGADEAFRLSGMSSLWAYFLFHSLRFLHFGGRMAWVLPGSAVHSDYARSLLEELAKRFARVAAISLKERIFTSEGTSEATQLLVCDGFKNREPSGTVELFSANTVSDCDSLLKNWTETRLTDKGILSRTTSTSLAPELLSEYQVIADSPQAVQLRELARLAIGVVTGANRVFIISDATKAESGIPNQAVRLIFAKFAFAPGVALTKSDLKMARQRGERCLLIHVNREAARKRVQKYFRQVSSAERKANVTFRKRENWLAPDDERIPDAFFPYMHHWGPRLVLNGCLANCTNNIHRIYFTHGTTKRQQRLAAISFFSTFSQLSAELNGRRYGGGVLKHELREAGNIRILMPTSLSDAAIDTEFKLIDNLLRTGSLVSVRKAVDQFLAQALPSLVTERILTKMNDALAAIRSHRQI